ncbi:MAG: cytochrome c-type biogenesis protein CcmH [Caldilineaceae bacterium]|nr:cytochrome c-type biogenesis protein CcmH [Caldilineaceae bacterium]
MKVLLRIGMLLLAVMITSGIASAQDTAAPQPVTPVTANDVNEVAKELWCPLCSGVRLDSCELKACDQMKDVIAEKLAAGEDTQAIKSYFVEQYGPQVLGEPPLEGFNWLAWILPVVAVIGGGIFLWTRARHMVRRPQPSPATRTSPANAETDDYAKRLEQELEQYD